MTLIERRISDRRVLKLLRQWLKAGVMEEGQWNASETGSPQGGVVSPLLANIYLHVLDMYWMERYSLLGKLVRYADDFVIICETQPGCPRSFAEGGADHDPTETNPSSHQDPRCEYEPGRFRLSWFSLSQKQVQNDPSIDSLYVAGTKGHEFVAAEEPSEDGTKMLYLTPQEIIRELNPIIRGWRNYFRLENSAKKLQQLDQYVWHRFRRWAF